MINLPDLRYNFHDSGLCDVAIGPRRELTLGLELDPVEQHPPFALGGARIRFGEIENIDEVRAFFEQLQRQKVPLYHAGRVQLNYARHLESRRNRLIFQVDFEYYGSCTICCRNVNIWQDDSLIAH